jgi:hypothetical protein
VIDALLVRAALLAALAVPLGAAATTSEQTLKFRVYLDSDPIGEHSFRLAHRGDGKEVVSEARFDVNLLIFNAYRYRHESREVWRDGCLERIEAHTDDNGSAYRVEGERDREALTLAVNGRTERLPACVSTFAYWDREFLKRGRLLNPQNGELIDVQVEPAGRERRKVAGRDLEAEAWRLRAEELDLTVWYSEDGRWIGLESATDKGRILRYEPL